MVAEVGAGSIRIGLRAGIAGIDAGGAGCQAEVIAFLIGKEGALDLVVLAPGPGELLSQVAVADAEEICFVVGSDGGGLLSGSGADDRVGDGEVDLGLIFAIATLLASSHFYDYSHQFAERSSQPQIMFKARDRQT